MSTTTVPLDDCGEVDDQPLPGSWQEEGLEESPLAHRHHPAPTLSSAVCLPPSPFLGGAGAMSLRPPKVLLALKVSRC